MSNQTLQNAFKHGTCARLRGDAREPTYDDPTHRVQWLKGWDCCDSNQQSYHKRKRKMTALDQPILPRFLTGVWFNEFAQHDDTKAWDRLAIGSMYSEISYESNSDRNSIIDYKWELGNRRGKSQAAHYIQQIGRILRDPTKADPKGQKMKSNLAYIFASMLPEVIAVKVAFTGPFDKSYTYKALKSQNIEVDQFVVVDSPNSGLTVVKVKEVTTFDDLDPGAYQGYKWIVGSVSTGDYSAITAKEQAFRNKVVELQRKAQREQAVALLAEEVGGLDALKAIMAELSAPTEAQPASDPTPAAE